MIENRHVSRVFATRACNFPAIQLDTQLLAPNMNDASPRCLHQNFTSTWRLFKEPCSFGRGLLLFSSTPRNETSDMPRENCQVVPVTL